MNAGKDIGSLEGMWSYVTSSATYEAMTFPKPARVVAYQVITPVGGLLTSEAPSSPSPMVEEGDVQKPMVGLDLQDFVATWLRIKTSGWAMTNVYMVYAPLRWSDIIS